MAIEIWYGGENCSDYGGSIIISREFYNQENKDYVWIEAQEVKNRPDVAQDGHFVACVWRPNIIIVNVPTEIHESLQ